MEPKIVVGTICSKKKKRGMMLPAGERYLGEHIARVRAIEYTPKADLYFLSGLYGFIPETKLIRDYDIRLLDDAIEDLAPVVARQLTQVAPAHVHFYFVERKRADWPYYDLLIEASRMMSPCGVRLHIFNLKDPAI